MGNCNMCKNLCVLKKRNDSCSSFNSKMGVDWIVNHDKTSNNNNKYLEIRFKGDRKELYLNKSNINIPIGSPVVVRVSSGWDLGIVQSQGLIVDSLIKSTYNKKREHGFEKENYISRIASPSDIKKWQENISKEKETLMKVRSLVQKHNVEMKISDVEYQADGQKIFFYYIAEDRIDFRNLLKDIVVEFRKKIELKQIGQRQETAKIGGLGVCGSVLCCSAWMKDFRSVNIDAVKYQQYSINSDKISGICGKLKCCLNFELDAYVEKLKEFPSKKIILKTKKGDAVLVKLDVFKELIWYSYKNNKDDKNFYKISLEKVNYVIKKNKEGLAVSSLEDISEEN